jgi:hypothetical protein
MALRIAFDVRTVSSLFALTSLVACAEITPLPPPPPPPQIRNTAVIEQPFDTVWARAVPALGRSFYVINNIDKASGLINLSYNGEPGGMITCTDNTLGAAQACRMTTGIFESGLTDNCVAGPMSMEGRTNIIFEKIADDATRVTVNVRHQLSIPYRGQGGVPVNAQTQFNTGQVGTFAIPGLAGMRCLSEGALERTLLQLVTGLDVTASAPAVPLQPAAAAVPPPPPVRSIGMAFQPENGVVKVINVFPGSPAAGAGIAVGDTIVQLNGASTAGLTQDVILGLLNQSDVIRLVIPGKGEKIVQKVDTASFMK